MQVVEGLANLSLPPTPRAMAVGGFDGFHVGHQYLLTQLCGMAWDRGFASSLLTFEPIPAEYFAGPDAPPKRLTTHDERIALAAALCCDLMVILEFGEQLVGMPSRAFCQDILVGRLNVKLLMASATHTMGHDRADLGQIRRLGEELGFEVVEAPGLEAGGVRVSSSEVRRLLAEGHVEETTGLLGRRYHVSGEVVAGRGVGRGLGFPTANLRVPHGKIVPADAVYAGLAIVEVGPETLRGTVWPAAISLGTAPTYGLNERLVEAHLLTEESLELLGCTVRLEFIRRVRWQEKFASEAQLQAQIARDVEEVQQVCAGGAVDKMPGAGRSCLAPTFPGCAVLRAEDT